MTEDELQEIEASLPVAMEIAPWAICWLQETVKDLIAEIRTLR